MVSGIALAGGKSTRMGGRTKALLEIGAVPIIKRVLDTLNLVFDSNIIITNTPEAFKFLGYPMFRDILPNCGSIGGLYTGLVKMGRPYGFLVACDMPFLRKDAIEVMFKEINDADVVIPEVDGKYEPLHAIYSKTCVPQIEEAIKTGDLKILNLFDRLKISFVREEALRSIDPELRFLMNVNTFSDLQRARGMDRGSVE